MNKQIEEMRSDLIEIFDEEYETRRLITPDFTAEKLTAKGYRKQEWISVEERLPDECGMPVLMVAVNQYSQTRVVKGFTDYQCPITFHTNEREYDGVWRAWEVTHWMPLPEAPKMRKEDEGK